MMGCLWVDNVHRLHNIYGEFFAWQFLSRERALKPGGIGSIKGSFYCQLQILKHFMWGFTTLS